MSVPSTCLVKNGTFLKWVRDVEIEAHMKNTTVETKSKHSNYIRLARNSFISTMWHQNGDDESSVSSFQTTRSSGSCTPAWSSPSNLSRRESRARLPPSSGARPLGPPPAVVRRSSVVFSYSSILVLRHVFTSFHARVEG